MGLTRLQFDKSSVIQELIEKKSKIISEAYLAFINKDKPGWRRRAVKIYNKLVILYPKSLKKTYVLSKKKKYKKEQEIFQSMFNGPYKI